MRNNRFFIRQYSANEFFHGGIGYVDAEKILSLKNFTPLLFPHYADFSMRAKLSRFFYLLKIFFTIPRGASLVFLFPVFAKMSRLLLRILRLKGDRRLVCFIADIDGIKDGDEQLLKKEIAELKRYRYFIVHNDAMRQWLQAQVPVTAIVSIEFFDFLANPFWGDREKNKQIVFAGNLEKSTFLAKLDLLQLKSPELHFNLYGPGCTDTMSSQANATFKGFFKPYELPERLEGAFGLVWDGDSIEKPGGSLGNYMQYISHHKLSLYIISGLPLIVPEMAASAPLVKKYGIGITINSLHEIQERIDSLSIEQYQLMRDNMKPLARKISAGDCLGEALDELMKFT
ncbi:MAG: hypothetical protein JWM28_4535 [Chitinophagaceae bacterium]|nr:hypothetical protein [Chitinophagaceae bacterium]